MFNFKRSAARLNIRILLYVTYFQIAAAWSCNCFKENGSSISSGEYLNCICDGSQNHDFTNLNNPDILTLKRYNYQTLRISHLANFKETLKDIELTEFYDLRKIEEHVFDGFTKLKSLSISKAPALTHLTSDIFGSDFQELDSIEIKKTGLKYVPEIRLKNKSFSIVNFEGNLIQLIKTNNIMINTDQIIFDNNKISVVEPWAFNNSNISKMSFGNNPQLRVLAEDAFHGLGSLSLLDLSETSIGSVPSTGLNDLETLIIRQTYTLRTIPSIYDFAKLEKAELTFSFHCCAFKLPQKHSPKKFYAYKNFSDIREKYCSSYERSNVSEKEEEWHDTTATSPNSNSQSNSINMSLSSFFNTQNTAQKYPLTIICGPIRDHRKEIQCKPQPNAFIPCEDIMGYEWLRVSVWFVLLFGLVGNFCVLTVILCKPSEMSVQNFLISNLALSDFLMAIYLLFLAIEDWISRGYYFNYAYNWQYGYMCQFAGFITIFSSQLSIYILCLLTIERWFTIKKALYLNKLNFHNTIAITSCGWLYALIMASLPLLGVSCYSKTSLCLPMDTTSTLGAIYILVLLLNGLAASAIVGVCYYQIYFSLSYETRHKDGEHTLARKMTVLVTTNFLCTIPIIFFGLTALFGFPLINITNSKILLVFFYPLNSCANPFLYAILTTNFKKNLIYLISKFGICENKKKHYKLVYYQPKGPSAVQIPRPLTSESTL